MPVLFLKHGEDRRLRAGHLWVFSNEVDVQRSPLTDLAPGQAVQLADSGGRLLGAGYANPASLIAVRMVSRNPEETLGPDMLRQRLQDALALRQRLFTRPFYRLCHGEGDFLPGLVVDRHGDHLVAQIGAAGMEAHTESLINLLDELFHPKSLLLDNDLPARTLEGLPRGQSAPLGTVPDEIEVEENGLRYLVPLAGGQKTGWFYDQRLNRAAFARFARTPSGRGADVLDAFCYAGGFGALALRHGAASVTFLDASASALDFARRNAERAASASENRASGHSGQGGEIRFGESYAARREVASLAEPAYSEQVPNATPGLEPPIQTVPSPASEANGILCRRGDALEELAALRREGRLFDAVCLDPPAFIKRRKDARRGLEAYARINELGLDLVAPGGVLLTCSCSHHLEPDVLRALAAKAASRRRRPLRLLWQGFQGPDHPIHPAMPETAYLKAFLFQAPA